jgi:very-short-patch-repair endonuclease
VIPFVVDQRNCLLFKPEAPDSLLLDQRKRWMASLQAALKRAIQAVFQLEDSELAAEALPSPDARREILFFESAEGGAGVLRRLVEDADALRRVAEEALSICHFDPHTGADKRKAPNAKDPCVAACYDCLLSYTNQRDHALLDRALIKDALLALRDAAVLTSPAAASRAEHLAALLKQCDSALERDWLTHIAARNFALPSHAQKLLESCATRPDFWYAGASAAIYVDGPHHDYPDRQQRDRAQQDCLDDHGITSIRFGHRDDWDAIIARHPGLFGNPA